MPLGRAASSSKSLDHISFRVIALVFVSPLSAQAQSDQSEDFQLDPTLIFSVVLVFGTIAAGLSWVAGLKPKKFQDGQPRSTSLYRVFQARMRAGEFASLAEEKAAPGASGPENPKNPEDAELDAFVDAYVDALEDEDSEQTDSGKIEKDGKEKPWKPLERRDNFQSRSDEAWLRVALYVSDRISMAFVGTMLQSLTFWDSLQQKLSTWSDAHATTSIFCQYFKWVLTSRVLIALNP